MVGQHCRLNRRECEQTLGDSMVAELYTTEQLSFHFTSLGDSEGQGILVCCSPSGCGVGRDLVTERQQHGNSSFNCLRQFHTVFHSGCTSYICTNKALGFPFLHIPTNMHPLSFFFFFFLIWLLRVLLQHAGSFVVAYRLPSCGTWTQQLQLMVLVLPSHVGSYFPDQELSLYPLHCKVDS